MSWIKEVECPHPWNLYSVMSINPAAMEAVVDMCESVTFGRSALTRVQEEALAVAVSNANRTRY